ncbi:MAG TPA: hypothetical protein VG963_26720 [Polyangiaceae bacterium]|nr:hypothetical protein [Polyangiaceae bacterium]
MALQPYRDILAVFAEYAVEYMVVGGYAVASVDSADSGEDALEGES